MFERVAPESVGMSGARLERITPWMERYVDGGKLPCALTAVIRRGGLAYLRCHGMADPETGRPVAEDTVFRIYSMTKPVVSAAAMTFFEEGRFQLDDPVAHFLPEFADTPVWTGSGATETEPPAEPLKVWHLLTHTSGLIYSGRSETPIADAYQAAGVDFSARNDAVLADTVRALATVPLRWQPGARWEYGVSTDVLGRLIEVLADRPLDVALKERVFDPLGMTDTGFQVRPDQLPRFAALYEARDDGMARSEGSDEISSFARPVTLFSGGGGLVGTAADYLRFAEMIRRKGVLDDTRVLGRRTVELMAMNQLPGNADMAAMGTPVHSETSYEGIGFGLGFSVVLDPATAKAACSPGELAWGGVASTAFWIDPVEEISVVFMTQVMPSAAYPIRRELRSLVYQSLID